MLPRQRSSDIYSVNVNPEQCDGHSRPHVAVTHGMKASSFLLMRQRCQNILRERQLRNMFCKICCGEAVLFSKQSRVQIVRSSLPYQVLLYLNAWYFGLFFIGEILIFVFKGETLPYPQNVLPAEVILVFILAGIETLRIFFALKGNLTERGIGVFVSLLLSIPACLGAVFLLLWQTYVLRIDLILAGIQLAFIGFELVFGLISIITFARATPY